MTALTPKADMRQDMEERGAQEEADMGFSDVRRDKIVCYKRMNAQQAANTSVANISTQAMIS